MRCTAFLALLICSSGFAQTPPPPEEGPTPSVLATELFETVVTLPVTVQPLYGGAHQGNMVLTHFKPPGDGPFPAVIMQHGRDGNQRATPARYRYSDVARYWVRRGVAVFVPTRVGYGDSGMDEAEVQRLAPHRSYPGNVPSTTIWVDALTPRSMGALMALYEHKVFCQAAIWGIHAYDQWGVELGKKMAKDIEAAEAARLKA